MCVSVLGSFWIQRKVKCVLYLILSKSQVFKVNLRSGSVTLGACFQTSPWYYVGVVCPSNLHRLKNVSVSAEREQKN